MEEHNKDSTSKKVDTENDLIEQDPKLQDKSRDKSQKHQISQKFYYRPIQNRSSILDANESEHIDDLNQADDKQGLLIDQEEEKVMNGEKSPNNSTAKKEQKSPKDKQTATPNDYKLTDEKSFNGDKKHQHSNNFENNDIEIEEEKKQQDQQINTTHNILNKHKQIMIGNSQPVKALFENPYGQSPDQAQQKKNMGKFTEFLIAEKQRKFVRLPRVYGKRKSMQFKCPNCKTDKEQKTKLKYECTGNQWCACIVFCFFALYPLCCVPFCIKRCYNIKHLCPQCMYQVGESGI